MRIANLRRFALGVSMTLLGGVVFVPGKLAAAEAKALGSCGADCALSCCFAQGVMCSCYCEAGYAVCGCLWTF